MIDVADCLYYFDLDRYIDQVPYRLDRDSDARRQSNVDTNDVRSKDIADNANRTLPKLTDYIPNSCLVSSCSAD